jgi:hypothetical protein
MTAALLGVGVCHTVTALGLSQAAPAGRVVLGVGGVATVLVAVFPLPAAGAAAAHAVAAGVAFVALAVWPALARRRGRRGPAALRPVVSVAAAMADDIDNDGDGRTDEDPTDDIDNDGDGPVNEDPMDNRDNDGDGRVDEYPAEGRVFCESGSDTDAWDPTDTRTPQRTMDRPWADGTPARVAVRAIGRPFWADGSAEAWVSQVYLDVRGPGILVDPAGADGNAPLPTFTLGSTVDLSFTVMNTGEATDTFRFTELVPDGFTAGTQTTTLRAGERATATVPVTVTGQARVGRHTLTARGISTTDPSVDTDYQFMADVVKRPLTLTYTGDGTVEHSDPAALSAAVRDGITNQPVAGRPVTFTVGDTVLSATTGADGVARATWLADRAPGSYTVSVATPEDGLYLGDSDRVPLSVTPEELTVTVTSEPVQSPAGQPKLTLRAVQEDDGHPADLTRAGAHVTLQPTLTSENRSYDVTFDAAGSATVPIDAPADVWAVRVNTTGGYFTAPPTTSELVLINPAGQLAGSVRGRDGAGTAVRLTSAVGYQGTTPVGSVIVDRGRPRFVADSVDWLVVVGNRAILQATGEVDDTPTVVRAAVVDEGNGVTSHDRFSVRISTEGQPPYDSGQLTADNGDLIVRSGSAPRR